MIILGLAMTQSLASFMRCWSVCTAATMVSATTASSNNGIINGKYPEVITAKAKKTVILPRGVREACLTQANSPGKGSLVGMGDYHLTLVLTEVLTLSVYRSSRCTSSVILKVTCVVDFSNPISGPDAALFIVHAEILFPREADPLPKGSPAFQEPFCNLNSIPVQAPRRSVKDVELAHINRPAGTSTPEVMNLPSQMSCNLSNASSSNMWRKLQASDEET